MGNSLSGSTLTPTSGALDSFVAELAGDIVYEKSMGSSRFLKTVKCRHRNGPLVIKVFIKPDPGISLRNYSRRLKLDREALLDIANVRHPQAFIETEKAGYIVRQWVASSLYDRISTRPFLCLVEKKWIAFQLLNALRDARNREVSHGDLKSENILVTSWNWVYLSDFASYKPTYLPLDDPADYSFFFDTSGRRTCYLAPERFYTGATIAEITDRKARHAAEDSEGKRDGKVTESMDCFSAGCVIAELFLEGAPLFTLSQLFKYREEEYNVDTQLASIEDDGIRGVIKQMINLDPIARPTFDTILHTTRGTVFPEAFYSFLHNYVISINELSYNRTTSSAMLSSLASVSTSSTNVPATSAALKATSATLQGNAGATESSPDAFPSDADLRVERIWADYESVEPYLLSESNDEKATDVTIDYSANPHLPSKPFQDVIPVELYVPNRDSKLIKASQSTRSAATHDGPALIVLALVTANIRNCTLPSSKLRALDVFLALSCHLTDEAKLDRMVPYVMELLHDEVALVRAAALRTLIQVLMLVTVFAPSNVAIFSEYIFPNVRHLVQDPEVSVRCTYAQCIVHLAVTAVRFLEMGQALKAHGAFNLPADTREIDKVHYEISYEASLQELQTSIQDHLSSLLVDSSSIVKRAILHDMSSLCIFLGRQKTNDVLLSHTITYLNDRDWLLRYAFFESIVDVAACAGGISLEAYILPLMIQALSDVEDTVVSRVLTALTSLCELGLFQKMRMWELMNATLGFLYHPNTWIRQGAASFISSASQQLSSSDVWDILYPSLRHFLKSDVVNIDEQSLLRTLKPPLPRNILDGAILWAKAERSNFWRGIRRGNILPESTRESVISVTKQDAFSKNKSDDDDEQLAKLRNLGMSSSDESKLLSMKEYIIKLGIATSSLSRSNHEAETAQNLKVRGTVELQKLGVVPQTIFLKTRTSEATLRSPRPPSSIPKSSGSPSARTPLSHHTRLPRFSGTSSPYDDLRRRLVANGSASSLNARNPREARTVSAPANPGASGPTPSLTAPSMTVPERPTSSSDSATKSPTLKPLNRLQIGIADGQKATPAVGPSKTNATGHLEAPAKIQSEDSSEISGRSSPILSTQTLRGYRLRSTSVLPSSAYDGHERGLSSLLENLYLDGNRDLQDDFGPKVHEGPVRRRNALRHSFGTRDGSKRRTEATLIASLTSHSEAITGLTVSPDHVFFVSASDDKTVKIWDTGRLERNVTSKPRHTYGQHHARIKSICMLEGLHCFASAADDGSLHVVRVHVAQSATLPKYGKLQLVREHQLAVIGEYITCMTHYNTDLASNLVYATTHSIISVMDLLTMRISLSMENPRHYGPITCLCLDRKRSWIVVGTSTGILTLWDKRFGLLLRSWHVAASHGGRSVRIHQCVIHPTKGGGKWIMVALETPRKAPERPFATLIEVWDTEKAVLMETFTTGTGSPEEHLSAQPVLVGREAETSPAAAIAALVKSRQAAGGMIERRASRQAADAMVSPPAPDIRTIAVGVDFGGFSYLQRSEFADVMIDSSPLSRTARGFMLTGSEDRKLRFWDFNNLEKTVVLNGLEHEVERPSYCTITGGILNHVENWPAPVASHNTRPPQRISLINHNQQNLLKSHDDVISALLCLDSPFRGGIVTGDRAGVIKVWRVEHLDP